MRELSIERFKLEVRIAYRGEEYLVRDNGSVCRASRPNHMKRPLDDVWTFGIQCSTNGYRRICGLVVHKIVATAFHGEQPSPSHVVDHIDTNRRNNRAENLRWVTRFENIAANDKTLRRIEQKWGSVEGMLQDPDRKIRADPLSARSWMPQKSEVIHLAPVDTASYTPSAVQRNWRTPCAFPYCPDKISKQPLHDYLIELKKGSIFSHNRFGESEVETAILSDDGSFLSVLTKIPSEIKGWGLATISVEAGRFVHEATGTFFTQEGAEKAQALSVGIPCRTGDTIDDFC